MTISSLWADLCSIRRHRIASILEMLGDDNIDEDDKPDSLKDLLRSILVMPLNVRLALVRMSETELTMHHLRYTGAR